MRTNVMDWSHSVLKIKKINLFSFFRIRLTPKIILISSGVPKFLWFFIELINELDKTANNINIAALFCARQLAQFNL